VDFGDHRFILFFCVVWLTGVEEDISPLLPYIFTMIGIDLSNAPQAIWTFFFFFFPPIFIFVSLASRTPPYTLAQYPSQ
jgi:hypothetical protein